MCGVEKMSLRLLTSAACPSWFWHRGVAARALCVCCWSWVCARLGAKGLPYTLITDVARVCQHLTRAVIWKYLAPGGCFSRAVVLGASYLYPERGYERVRRI